MQGYEASYSVYLMDLAYMLVPLLLAFVSFALMLQLIAKSIGSLSGSLSLSRMVSKNRVSI